MIAPLVTNESGVLRQSIYYPYAWALRYARGRVLDLRVESETYPINATACRPTSRATPTCRSSTSSPPSTTPHGQAAVLMLNRDLDAERELVARVGRRRRRRACSPARR